MRVRRYIPRRRNPLPWILAGCMVALLFAVAAGIAGIFIVLKLLPNAAMQAAGFQPAGDTDGIFNQPVAPTPVIIGQATIAAPAIVVDAGQYGQHSLSDFDTGGVEIMTGSTTGDAMQPDIVRATVNESGLLDICRRYTVLCSPAGEPVRNVTFDLRPGGLIVNGEFWIPQAGIWQQAGVVLRLTGSNTLEAAGVDVNGTLFTTPPGELSDLVNQAALTVSDLLRQLALETGGTRYTLREIYIDDRVMTLILR